MTTQTLDDYKYVRDNVRIVPDFPKKGIMFLDITTAIKDAKSLRIMVDFLYEEFKDKNSQIPWGKIMGFRNGIVHEYGKTDFTIVYETAVQDLKDLKSIFNKIV